MVKMNGRIENGIAMISIFNSLFDIKEEIEMIKRNSLYIFHKTKKLEVKIIFLDLSHYRARRFQTLIAQLSHRLENSLMWLLPQNFKQ